MIPNTLKPIISRRLKAISTNIEKLQNEHDELMNLLNPPKPRIQVRVCLYDTTVQSIGTQFDITFIPINNNKDITLITNDLLKNNVDIQIFDDSRNEEDKKILDSYKEYIDGYNK